MKIHSGIPHMCCIFFGDIAVPVSLAEKDQFLEPEKDSVNKCFLSEQTSKIAVHYAPNLPAQLPGIPAETNVLQLLHSTLTQFP
jgi:hypothetical protein